MIRSDDVARFLLSFVEDLQGCWIWKKAKNHLGYGRFRLRSLGDKTVRAHRYAYQAFVAEIPPGFLVLHHCDNPSCVNPDHLWLGTSKDNSDDKIRKGRDRFIGRPTLNRSKKFLVSRRRQYWRSYYYRKKMSLTKEEFTVWCKRREK